MKYVESIKIIKAHQVFCIIKILSKMVESGVAFVSKWHTYSSHCITHLHASIHKDVVAKKSLNPNHRLLCIISSGWRIICSNFFSFLRCGCVRVTFTAQIIHLVPISKQYTIHTYLFCLPFYQKHSTRKSACMRVRCVVRSEYVCVAPLFKNEYTDTQICFRVRVRVRVSMSDRRE